MRGTASKQRKWQSATIFTAVLVGAAASIAAMASGCGPNQAILNNVDCPDAGTPDGGDAGEGGGGGLNDPNCK